jgi:glucosamine--fructose-6-phosphate aminotransferase (isomerizing)
MCGIVGYLGPKEPKDVILKGLKSLEYRGYDSAGVAILDGEKFKRVRAYGKLSALEEKLKAVNFGGHLGIGHTRWATHGVPSERNAHPHSVSGVSLVHNGIIENYAEIREELLAAGAKIDSDTDSELVAHLISQEKQNGLSLEQAVYAVAPRLHGAYAILVVAEDEPECMIAFKSGPPLIIGLGEKEVVIASDVQAIISHTRRVMYLEDDELAVIRGAKVQVTDLKGRAKQKPITEIDWTAEVAEKKGFKHFMLKEIHEEPRALAAAIEPHINRDTHTVTLNDAFLNAEFLKTVERVFVVACGTSYYAGQVGEYLIERLARVPVEVEVASEFRYRQPVIPKGSVVVVVSQSGETADTLAALRLCRQQGFPVVSFCNVRQSTIDREAQAHLYMNSGAEIGVASTKAFMSSLGLFHVFATALARAKGAINDDAEKTLVRSLLGVPSQMEGVLSYDKYFAEAADALKGYKGFLYLGRGVNYPIAMEGALKMKELAYLHAEGYAAGEMKHGPLALIDSNMAIVVVAPKDDLFDKTLSNLEEAKARGGQIISIGTNEDQKLIALSQRYLSLPDAHWSLNPILAVIPLQLLAYHVADALEHDVDQPRNLAKSVTVE